MTTQSYTEQQGARPFNWVAFLDREEHGFREWIEANKLAAGWVSCACGSQCAALPRKKSGKPLDEELAGLGLKFYLAITQMDAVQARVVLEQIEHRSSLLLSQIKSRQLLP
jgi:hypothetical protein